MSLLGGGVSAVLIMTSIYLNSKEGFGGAISVLLIFATLAIAVESWICYQSSEIMQSLPPSTIKLLNMVGDGWVGSKLEFNRQAAMLIHENLPWVKNVEPDDYYINLEVSGYILKTSDIDCGLDDYKVGIILSEKGRLAIKNANN